MNKLSQIIKDEIRQKGSISFKSFVELALYHPHFGYYSSAKAKIGKEGDFYTSPSVHSSFGEVISNLIVKAYKTLNNEEFTVVEFGAGKGYLALDILNALKKNHFEIYKNIKYKIIEISTENISSGKKLLKNHSSKVKWRKEIDEVIKTPVKGIILSNEFVDAFPFHRIKMIDGKPMEIYVDIKDENFTETYIETKNVEFLNYKNNYADNLQEGQEIEINLLVRKWLDNVNMLLNKGFLLTIDYGYLADELYSPSRMKGTFKCFHKHNLSTNPFENIGYQDITYDVNFSDLIEYGKKIGLKKVKYISQGQFLVDWGILKILKNYSDPSNDKDRMAIKNLIMPELMGSKFKFLIQGKGLSLKIVEKFYKEGEFRLIRNTS